MQRFILTLWALCFSIHTQGSIGLILLREEGIGKNLTIAPKLLAAADDTIFASTALQSEDNLPISLCSNRSELGLDDILYEIQNGTYKYYHTDGLGSVTGITNETQQLIKRNYYRAYGEIYRSWGSNKSKIGFTSRDFNKDTGLIDLRARQYDPVIGRFLSPDPFTRGPDDPRVRDMYKSSWYSKIHGELTLYTSFMKPNEFNRYAYCNNNPVNYVDPLGLEVELTSHKVFKYKNDKHAAIKVTPENQNRWSKKSFMQKDASGKAYFTLSAGPSDGMLTSEMNRSTDSAEGNSTESKINVPKNINEDQFIGRLLKADMKYKDNATYDMWPKSNADGYNSNSYIAGILNQSGAKTPSLSKDLFPGYSKPLPKKYFDDN